MLLCAIIFVVFNKMSTMSAIFTMLPDFRRGDLNNVNIWLFVN